MSPCYDGPYLSRYEAVMAAVDSVSGHSKFTKPQMLWMKNIVHDAKAKEEEISQPVVAAWTPPTLTSRPDRCAVTLCDERCMQGNLCIHARSATAEDVLGKPIKSKTPKKDDRSSDPYDGIDKGVLSILDPAVNACSYSDDSVLVSLKVRSDEFDLWYCDAVVSVMGDMSEFTSTPEHIKEHAISSAVKDAECVLSEDTDEETVRNALAWLKHVEKAGMVSNRILLTESSKRRVFAPDHYGLVDDELASALKTEHLRFEGDKWMIGLSMFEGPDGKWWSTDDWGKLQKECRGANTYMSGPFDDRLSALIDAGRHVAITLGRIRLETPDFHSPAEDIGLCLQKMLDYMRGQMNPEPNKQVAA